MRFREIVDVHRGWIGPALLGVFVAGCGGGSDQSASVAPVAAAPATGLAAAVTQADGPPPAQHAAQPAPGTPPADKPFEDPIAYSGSAFASLPRPVAESAAISHHRLVLSDAKTIAYTASAGHLTAVSPQGAPEVSVFYVAYTADGGDAAQRPVTFLFNGGPKSASAYLHLGSWGPHRLKLDAPRTDIQSAPLVDSPDSLLDVTDLVFVDAPGTGYSEAVAPYTNQDFLSVDKDAEVFRDFVIRYAEANQRKSSPKYLYGESYAGIRTPILANILEIAGVQVSGVILNSPIMNYNTACDTDGYDCTGFMRSYAAVSTYYGKSKKPASTTIHAYMQEAREFALNQLDPAVELFHANAKHKPLPKLLETLSDFTGVSAADWGNDFNMAPEKYWDYIQPSFGYYSSDARVHYANLKYDGDLENKFKTETQNYLQSVLGYSSKPGKPYIMSGEGYYSMSHDALTAPDSIPDLASAAAQNPNLKTLVLHGYHDLNCPFYQTEKELSRLKNFKNLTVRTYEGGHMTYMTEASRAPMKADLVNFYKTPAGNAEM